MARLAGQIKDSDNSTSKDDRCSVFKWRSPLQWQLDKCKVDSAYKDWILASDCNDPTTAHVLEAYKQPVPGW